MSSSQNGQYLSMKRQNNLESFFQISDVLITHINHFQSSKPSDVKFFWEAN